MPPLVQIGPIRNPGLPAFVILKQVQDDGSGGECYLLSMTKRATQRPEPFAKPAHWTNDPAPAPAAPKPDEEDPSGLSPTRYGDWVKDGIAVDF